MKHYHFIFTGSGLSALMTVYRMAVSGKFTDHSILLIDENLKKSNDRTWCFWESPNGEFESIVSKTWDNAYFIGESFTRELELQPYQYKMIRGIAFYDKVFAELQSHKNITFLHEKVVDFSEVGTHALVKTESQTITCNRLINSIYNPTLPLSQKKFPVLNQHFVGWFIKSKEAVFNPNAATFMDFSVEQKGNTRFMYVLPTSPTEALIEYTLFSKDLLPQAEYETAIKEYILQLGISDYEIVEKEKGSIPMTAYPFWKHNSKNSIHIGSAGGWTKASTGYTFKNTVKHSKKLVEFLQTDASFETFHKTDEFWFYDLLLLDILSEKNQLGKSIFSSMFRTGNPALIFKFLDEDTSVAEDLQVILKCPKKLFLQALYQRIFK